MFCCVLRTHKLCVRVTRSDVFPAGYIPEHRTHVVLYVLSSLGSGVYGLGSLLVYFPAPPFWEHLCI